jgi:hypothetical protein
MAAMVLVLMAVMVIQRPDLVLMVTLKSRMVFSLFTNCVSGQNPPCCCRHDRNLAISNGA